LNHAARSTCNWLFIPAVYNGPMSSFLLLRDPGFVLTWQVHVGTVALCALLGIAMGVTRRAWYVGPLVFCGLLWLFVPLAAPEPVIVLLMAVPPLAVGCRLFRRRLQTPAAEATDEPTQATWRFRLVDLFWLTLIVGLLTALVTQCWRQPWKIFWPDIAISAFCFWSLGLAVVFGSRLSTIWRQVLAMGAIMLLSAAAAGLHLMWVKRDWLLLSDWEMYASPAPFMVLTTRSDAELFLIYWLTFAEYVVLVAIGLELLLPPVIQYPRRLALTSKVAAGIGLGLLILGLARVYVAIFQLPGWPEEDFPPRNDRVQLFTVLERQHSLNPRSVSLDELRATGFSQTADTVAESFDELESLLDRDSVTLFDSRTDDPNGNAVTHFGSVSSMRGAARTLTAQAVADWEAGRRAEALRYNAICLQLAAMAQHRGTMVDALVGVAIEGIAVYRLANVRTELSNDEARRVISLLQHIVASRAPLQLLWARDSVYGQELGGWRSRLNVACQHLWGQSQDDGGYRSAFDRRDALLSLLTTDLAIRCHWRTHGRLPERLDELVPHHLPSLPHDPFCDQPLHYRIADEDFVLYSVGPDGIDNGGQFGDSTELMRGGRDLDLDFWIR